jgi:hypothetical protein
MRPKKKRCSLKPVRTLAKGQADLQVGYGLLTTARLLDKATTITPAFIVSAVIGKYDKLAYTLMALYVLLMAVLVHLPRAGESEMDMFNVFRNIMVTGALLGFAKFVARDKRVIG